MVQQNMQTVKVISSLLVWGALPAFVPLTIVCWGLWSQQQQKGINRSNPTMIQLAGEFVEGYSTYYSSKITYFKSGPAL